MEYFEILNDSLLNNSMWPSNPHSIYKVKNDTLFIKEAYNWYGPNNSSGYTVIYHDYKIMKMNSDTIILKNDYHGYFATKSENWENPLVFVNLEKLKQPVNDFKFLKLNYSNQFDGSTEVTVDSVGGITYHYNHATILEQKRDSIDIRGHLSQGEFENFKMVLSKSLVKTLPVLRGCGLDEAHIEFIVMMNNITFVTKGCTMYYPQRLLFKYLYDLKTNSEIKKLE